MRGGSTESLPRETTFALGRAMVLLSFSARTAGRDGRATGGSRAMKWIGNFVGYVA
jgi:hypothetical protein